VRSSYFPLQERNSNNTVAQEYFWDTTKAGGIGGLLHLIQNAQQYSYTYDGKGNVAALLDSSQSPIISYAYSPLGDLVLTYGNFKQPFTLSTKSYSPETGLSYFGFRFYSAELGQWLNRDPIGERGGINLYNFVGNNPVMRRDPFGLDTAMPVDGSDCPNYENQGRAEENRQVPQEYDQYGEQGDNDYYDGWVKTYEKEQARAADQATQATVAGMGPIVMDFAFGEEVAFLWGLYSFQQAALNGDLPGVGWGVGGILLPGRWGKTVTAVGDVWNLITVQSQQFGGTR